MSDIKAEIPPQSAVPRHIAVIMDGNGRWARRRHLPRFAGHKAGLDSVRSAVRTCLESGVRVLTLFAFSSENWRRPAEEVKLLMNLFATALNSEVKRLHQHGVRLRIIGDRSRFSETLCGRIAAAEELTAENSALDLVIAANYGGRWEIARAAAQLAAAAVRGEIDPDAIGPNDLGQYLSLADLPEPDLFIRTGGEQRISNFLLWQLAYTELYFTPLCWPDFNQEAFMEAINSFATRERRFGRTSEQVGQARGA